jgi:hypothetical protein
MIGSLRLWPPPEMGSLKIGDLGVTEEMGSVKNGDLDVPEEMVSLEKLGAWIWVCH